MISMFILIMLFYWCAVAFAFYGQTKKPLENTAVNANEKKEGGKSD
jgi:hypothetical protein